MWQKTEPFALPAELRAQIGHFSIKKVAKNGFLRYSILREKSEKPNEKLEGRIRQVMEVHMNANRTLSQLSYGPISKSIMLMQTTQQIYEIYCKNERHGLMGDGC